MRFWAELLGSFFIVAFGQPQFFAPLGIFSSAVGIALFWKAMLRLSCKKRQIGLAVFWFFSVQAVQISWMASTAYMGFLILVVYFFLCLAIGMQFGLVSLFLSSKKPLNFTSCLAAAGCWALLEWIRIFPCTGFPWNPLGLSLAGTDFSLQFAAIFGVYGLSFWVLLVNLFALNAFVSPSKKAKTAFVLAAFFPYLFGFVEMAVVEKVVAPKKKIHVALVQTSLLPEEKDKTRNKIEAFIPPLQQWARVFELFYDKSKVIDLIVLPEAALPYGAYSPIYPLEAVEQLWRAYFGEPDSFPPLKKPFAVSYMRKGRREYRVTNAFIAQALANRFQGHLISGFDDEDVADQKNYNAAFHFTQFKEKIERYEKQILVPVAEYIPLSSIKEVTEFIAKEFGIEGSFDQGIEPKVFPSIFPVGISICAEETYSHIIRKIRQKGAEIFVNITNDVWFPGTKLPKLHLDHGRIRAVENGVFLLRACNTGVTGVVDCFGRVVSQLEPSEKIPGVLLSSFSPREFPTLYLLWGDGAVLLLSALFFLLFLRKKLL